MGDWLVLPAFDGRGLLPAFLDGDPTNADRSPYLASMSEIVARFGTSQRRRNLLANLLDYRELLATDDYVSGLQFVDGSFVEDVETIQGRAPDDIDVFSFLSAPQKYHQDRNLWGSHGLPFWRQSIADRDANKQRFSLDTYAALIEELGVGGVIEKSIYWYSLFAHQRDTFAWKGFVRVPLNSADDQVARQLLHQAQVP